MDARLDPDALKSCGTVEGCPGSGTQALYSGTVDAGLMAYLVGAGCVPALLNWDEEPAVKPIHGQVGWRDVGVFDPLD